MFKVLPHFTLMGLYLFRGKSLNFSPSKTGFLYFRGFSWIFINLSMVNLKFNTTGISKNHNFYYFRLTYNSWIISRLELRTLALWISRSIICTDYFNLHSISRMVSVLWRNNWNKEIKLWSSSLKCLQWI